MSALLLHRDETVLDEGHIPVRADDRWAVSDQSCHVIAHRRCFNPNRRITGYGILRSIGEVFREPDAHMGFVLGSLTMGQLLSLPMVLLGFTMLLVCYRKGCAHRPVSHG